jgi:hypothetical protein
MLGLLFCLLFFGAIVGLLAKRKNRDPLIWGIFGAFFFMFALIVLMFMPYLCPKCKKPITNTQRKNKECLNCMQFEEESKDNKAVSKPIKRIYVKELTNDKNIEIEIPPIETTKKEITKDVKNKTDDEAQINPSNEECISKKINMIKVICPKCNKEYEVEEEQLGLKADCEACGNVFFITELCMVWNKESKAINNNNQSGSLTEIKDRAEESNKSANDYLTCPKCLDNKNNHMLDSSHAQCIRCGTIWITKKCDSIKENIVYKRYKETANREN